MTAKPLPPHGSSARAYGSPGYRPRCKCDLCRATLRRLEKRAKYNRECGRTSFTGIDAARQHLTELHTKMSWPALQKATGVPLANLLLIHNGTRAKIRLETQARILAVKFPEAPSPGKVIDPTGSVRRLRALLALGHSLRTIADAADSDKDVLRRVVSGRRAGVRQSLAARISKAYDTLAEQTPPNNKFTARTRNLALTAGWHPPSHWDEETIDDPSAAPEQPTEMGRNELAAYRRQEIAHLASFGVAEHDIAARLDMNQKTVHELIRDMRKAA